MELEKGGAPTKIPLLTVSQVLIKGGVCVETGRTSRGAA